MNLVLIFLTPFTFTFWLVSNANYFFNRIWLANFPKLSLDRKCWHAPDPNESFSEGLPKEKHWSLKASLLFDQACTVLYISKGDLVIITFDPCNYILVGEVRDLIADALPINAWQDHLLHHVVLLLVHLRLPLLRLLADLVARVLVGDHWSHLGEDWVSEVFD